MLAAEAVAELQHATLAIAEVLQFSSASRSASLARISAARS
jgi:hypothetical protein